MSNPSNALNYSPYHRLVRVYPAGRRRDELLDTMIMAAEDDARSRPSRREVADVLRNAPRAWLGRAGSRGVVVAAAMFAMLTALITGSLAAEAAASALYEPPTAAELAGVGGVVAPGVTFTTAGRYDAPLVTVNRETRSGYTWLAAEPDAVARGFRPYTEGVVARLRQAGWQTTWVTEPPNYASTNSHLIFASKAGLVLEISTSRTAGGRVLPDGRIAGGLRQLEALEAGVEPAPGSPGAVDITVRRAESGVVVVAAGIGAVAGLTLGWLLAGWASRRTERHLWASTALAVLTAVPVLTVAPWVWDGVRNYLYLPWYDRTSFRSPFWAWLFEDGFRILTAPAAVALISAAVVTVLVRPRAGRAPAPPAAATRRPATVIAAVLLATTVVALAGAYLYSFGIPFMGPEYRPTMVGSLVVSYGLPVVGAEPGLTAAGVAAVVLSRIVIHLRRLTTTSKPLNADTDH